MNTIHRLALVALGLVLSTAVLAGQGQAQYRDFQLGADLASVAARIGVASSGAKTIHVRPALMQELKWWPPYYLGGSAAPQNDPVQTIAFSFYNDHLFRLVIDYDLQRTNAMTDADMIAAVSGMYGSPLPPDVERTEASPVPSKFDTPFGITIARWGDLEYSVVLDRSRFGSAFRITVTSLPLDALARAAETQAVQLDELEAPQREAAQREKAAEVTRVSQERTRLTNKAAFRP